jgi:hypothetical protein
VPDPASLLTRMSALDDLIAQGGGPRRRELCQQRDRLAQEARDAGLDVPAREPLIGERACRHCQAPLFDHCDHHVVPCCPGKCPGPTWLQRLLSEPVGWIIGHDPRVDAGGRP